MKKKDWEFRPQTDEEMEERRKHNEIYPHYNPSDCVGGQIENHLAEINQLVSYLPKKQRESLGKAINCSVGHIWQLLPVKFKKHKKYGRLMTLKEK